jgi:hypothetical protein
MATFIAVNDLELSNRIGRARNRIVFIAPGISAKVAGSIGNRFQDVEKLDVTIVLDPDEDVCRIGYGDIQGLELLQRLAVKSQLALRKQHGLRIGVLLTDEEFLVWSPTPQSVEAVPLNNTSPNGLALGRNPEAALIAAVAPEGTDTVPSAAEIGTSPVTTNDVQVAAEAIHTNPVIPVALAQVTRVFSSKLQFVELEIRNARLSRTTLSIPRDLLNADVTGELRTLLDTKLQAFVELRHYVVDVPAFTPDGEPAYRRDSTALTVQVSEADLDRTRTSIERRFLHRVGERETLIARNDKQRFEACIAALKVQLHTHADKVRTALNDTVERILDEAAGLIMQRLHRSETGAPSVDIRSIRERLRAALARRQESEPSVSIRYKDVTFEHTQSEDFRERVRRTLPPQLQRQLGSWDDHFRAAKEN